MDEPMLPHAVESEPAIDPDFPIVDTHIHLWNASGFDYFADEYLQDVARSGHNVVSSIHVECGSGYFLDGERAFRPVGETVLAVTEAKRSHISTHGLAAGIVGWVDVGLGVGVKRFLEAHIQAAEGRFRGVRYRASWDRDPEIAYDGPEYPTSADVFEDPAIMDSVRCLAELGLILEVWVFHHQLEYLSRFIARCPDLPIVVNHVGGPVGVGRYADKRSEVFADWSSALRLLQGFPNVVVKLDGIGISRFGFGFSSGKPATSSDSLVDLWRPYVSTCLDVFGAERCLFGTNVPVDRFAAPMGIYINAFKKMLGGASQSERTSVFSANAKRVYRV